MLARAIAEKENGRGAIVARGNTVPVFQANKHDFDAVAGLIPVFV